MSKTQISGRLPSSLMKATTLMAIDLGECKLNGDLRVLSKLSEYEKLKFIHLNDNQLSGSVSSAMRMRHDIRSILLYNNRLSGSIPEYNVSFSRRVDQGKHDQNWQMQHLSLSNNQLSGTLSKWLCRLTRLEHFAANWQKLSGTLSSCLGNLTSMKTFAVGRNYIDGVVPSAFDSLSSLKTLFMLSNRLVCNCPHLDSATELGTSETSFKGVVYPAQFNLYGEMFESTQIGGTQYIEYVSRAHNEVPGVPNAVLLYTGNAQLTTDAQKLSRDETPNSLEKDEVQC